MKTNNTTILSYLKPNDNEMLSSVNEEEIKHLIQYLDKYYLEYRNNLNILNDNTFGIEIEFENYSRWYGEGFFEFRDKLKKIVKNDKWQVVADWSLHSGGEIVSEVLTDTKGNWDKVKGVCNFISTLGEVGANCGAHVHVGSQILGDNPVYWKRFFKLWSVYENIIYRFCYGEHFGYRPTIMKYSRPAASFYMSKLKLLKDKNNYNVLEMLWSMEPLLSEDRYTKNFGLSYWRILADDKSNIYRDINEFNKGCTVELRVPNGTFNEIIWQNNINFFIKMMLYCKSDKYNQDIIDRRMVLVEDKFSNLLSYSSIYLDQVLEFVDMIFDNNLDKIYFLKQYIKEIDEHKRDFSKTKKLTLCKRM